MTHDELLAKINNYSCCSGAHELALRAVVELHKPFNIQEKWRESDLFLKHGLACSLCSTEIYIPYPCPTIQAIKKELM